MRNNLRSGGAGACRVRLSVPSVCRLCAAGTCPSVRVSVCCRSVPPAPVRLSICLSVRVPLSATSTCPSVRVSVCRSMLPASVRLSVRVSVCGSALLAPVRLSVCPCFSQCRRHLSVSLSVCPCVSQCRRHVSVCLSACPSVRPRVAQHRRHLSVCPSVCLSVCPCVGQWRRHLSVCLSVRGSAPPALCPCVRPRVGQWRWQVCRRDVSAGPCSRCPRHASPSAHWQRWKISRPCEPFRRCRVHTWPSRSTGLQILDQKWRAQHSPAAQSDERRQKSPSSPAGGRTGDAQPGPGDTGGTSLAGQGGHPEPPQEQGGHPGLGFWC